MGVIWEMMLTLSQTYSLSSFPSPDTLSSSQVAIPIPSSPFSVLLFTLHYSLPGDLCPSTLQGPFRKSLAGLATRLSVSFHAGRSLLDS